MATIKYRLHSKTENAPIYLRLSLGRAKTEKGEKPKYISYQRKIGLSINSKDWSATGLPKQNNPTNKNLTTNLRKLTTSILQDLNDANSIGTEVNGEWLSYRIDLYYNRVEEKGRDPLKQNLEYWIKHIIETAHTRVNGKKGIGLSESRIKAYNGLLTTLQEYQAEHKNIVKIIEMNKAKFDEIKLWLFDVCMYAPSTAIKKLIDFKRVVKEAKEKNIIVANDFENIKFPSVETYDNDMDVITLTLSDIEKIENVNLVSDALINARKWLILSCFTGQRGKDLTTRIIKDNFILKNDRLRIEIKQEKGNKQVLIPVLPRTKEIFDKGLPYIISMQKLNKHIKKVCEIAEINEMIIGKKREKIFNSFRNKMVDRHVKGNRPKYEYIGTHTGRRTFATIHYDLEMSVQTIMQVTGHKKEVTFYKYINRQSEKHIETFDNLYDELEKKVKKQTNLRVVKNLAINQ